MKKMIAHLAIAIALTFGISTVSVAQTTKSDFDKALLMVGTTFDSITKIEVSNTELYYNDASAELHRYKYWTNPSLSTSESGVFIKAGSVYFIPFTSIKSFQVWTNDIEIILLN